MSLESGSQLGIYTIVEPLGAGGMGEVYRATDSKLDREVAIKVLPEAVANDAERVARFEREAKVLAALNHPMIAAIYGFDEADGKRFLVLELVEGPTLADRLASGRLPVEECLDIGRQIAEALEVAHEKGIIHRDLKPANVKVTADGDVKVLDFGLAKALTEDEASFDPASSPTITENFTAPGIILGTAAYMSPEQARGRPVDKRSDIWSFGCVLYECLTADSLFRGETVTDSVGAILHKQPEWDKLPANTPPTVQLLLRRCLAKDRKRRLRDIGDVRIELEAAIADPTSSVLGLASAALVAEGTSSWLSWRSAPAMAVTMLLSVLATLGIVSAYWPEAPPPPTVQQTPPPPPMERYNVALPQRESQLPTEIPAIAVSPDGRSLGYFATSPRPSSSDGGPRIRSIFLRRNDHLLPAVVAEDVGRAHMQAFSPDGNWLAYFDVNRDALLKVSVLGGVGGPPRKLCDCSYGLGLTWTTTGHIVFIDRDGKPVLRRVGENGGAVEEFKVSEREQGWPGSCMPCPMAKPCCTRWPMGGNRQAARLKPTPSRRVNRSESSRMERIPCMPRVDICCSYVVPR